MNRTLIAILFAAGCTASVRTAGPPPAEPLPPPPAPAPAPAPVATQPPADMGAHPAYVSAIRHMRYARALVERTGPGTADVKLDEGTVIRDIDAAIKLAHDAHVDDGRPLTEHPAVDTAKAWPTRLRTAIAEIGAAIHEIDDALRQIHEARVDDGKPATEHAPIESKLVYRDRLKEAEKNLHEAAQDLEQREDNFWAKKDRRQAVDAIR